MTATLAKTDWLDDYNRQKERLDAIPDHFHPSARHLIEKFEAHIQVGLTHEYLTPEEAARA